MKKFLFGGLVGCLLMGCLAGCTPTEKKEIIRISDVPYTVISDSLGSEHPVTLLAYDGKVYWSGLIGNRVHAIDVKAKKEVCTFGRETTSPDGENHSLNVFLSTDGQVFLADAIKGWLFKYTLDSENTVKEEMVTCARDRGATRMTHLGKNHLVRLRPEGKKLFTITVDKQQCQFGTFPTGKKYKNALNLYQGSIAFNPVNHLLVYSCFFLPYMATYSWDGSKLVLEHEVKKDFKHRVVDGEFKAGKEVGWGGIELGLTRSHVTTIYRDREVEGMPSTKNISYLLTAGSKSLFVFDYELNLSYILNLPFPIMRVTGDVKSEKIYVITEFENYTLLEIDLDDLKGLLKTNKEIKRN